MLWRSFVDRMVFGLTLEITGAFVVEVVLPYDAWMDWGVCNEVARLGA